jgi:hypothetical protein
MEPPLHPAVEHLAFLLGTWTGEGRGEYPTIEPFAYGEEIRFWHVGKPNIAYAQRTWLLADGTPSHAETGYWRPAGDGRVELVLAHPTGVVEVAEGTVTPTVIELVSTTMAGTATAKSVTQITRTFLIAGDTMTYDLRMAAVGEPLTHHLGAELRRT